MATRRTKYIHRGILFKEHVVREHLKDGISKKRLAKLYGICPKEIKIWAERFLAGQPLEMKMGRPRKIPLEPGSLKPDADPEPTETELRAENKRLRAELAYKTELIKLIQSRLRLKKKTDSESFKG